MLGLTAPVQKWVWSASGKHPVAKDFLRIGPATAIGIGLSEWVAKGVAGLRMDLKTGRLPRFWRFWARGGGKNELVCGVLRDSCDSVGRAFPFLVLGTGGLPGCEEHWDLLPYGCEISWKRIEYLCTRNYADVAGIDREVANLRPPQGDWRQIKATCEAGANDCPALGGMEFNGKAGNGDCLTVKLDMAAPDTLLLVGLLLKRIRERHRVAPNIAFIGGTSDAAYLSIYWRPLLAGDFATLWG
ncbi:hypothetical protein OR1_01693 [Geobacter sp. OR-1]|uniref:TagF domain-containing protein n=1 Tax=Geobacter sp. OR-1 TaxID=1266765 RepID=UPI000543EC6E|nr:TagF domain-containing protein [Geobacter sp. OR-1]GAM09415.1 hypothetical protein OR1_01693 [Geobacter sp. OR-1]